MSKRGEHESIRFDVQDWWLDYSIMVSDQWKPGDIVPRCSEMQQIKVSGPLRSKTSSKRADRVLLTVDPNGADPDNWKEEWKGVGIVEGVRRGAIWARVYLQVESFNMLLTALGAQGVRRLYIGAERTERRGEARVTLFQTVDPDEDEE